MTEIQGFQVKKKYFKKISFFRPANEKRRKSAGFQDFPEIFFLHGQFLPPYSICGSTLILGGMRDIWLLGYLANNIISF